MNRREIASAFAWVAVPVVTSLAIWSDGLGEGSRYVPTGSRDALDSHAGLGHGDECPICRLRRPHAIKENAKIDADTHAYWERERARHGEDQVPDRLAHAHESGVGMP